MSPRFLRFAALFYGSLVLVALAWNAVRGRETLFLGESVAASLGWGVATAAATVLSGFVLYRLIPLFRQLTDELAPQVVDGSGYGALLLLSLYSGVGEEVLFRGAVQPEFGLIVAAIVFGLVHIGPDRRYLLWTAWAIAAGFLFGFLYEFTGGLLAPALAHTLHNATTMTLWKLRRERSRGRSKVEIEEAGE